MPTLATAIQYSFRSLSHEIREEKKNKRDPDCKRRRLSLFADDTILYKENPTDSIRKLIELINEYCKVTGHKINTQKSLAFLHTNNEKIREIRKQSHSPLPQKD